MYLRTILTLIAGVLILLGGEQEASGQEASGSIVGTIRNKASKTGLEAATIAAVNARGQNFSTTTDVRGRYSLAPVPPGTYQLLILYGEDSVRVRNITVAAGLATTVNRSITASGEDIEVRGRKRVVESDRNRIVTSIDREAMERLPIPGSSFEGLMDQSATAIFDGEGFAVGGASSLEGRFVLNGHDVTSLSDGRLGSPMSMELLDQVDVVTGGYSAEYGRATGAIVNVETRTGTNEFHGTIFSQFTNSFLQKRTARAPLESWIDVETNQAYDLTLGVTLGGPIIKDKLWFFVGLVPRLIATDTDRITKRQTDCRKTLDDGSLSACEPRDPNDPNLGFTHEDGIADVDENGFVIYEELDRKTLRSQATEYQFVSKINLKVDDNHSGQVTFSGTPFSRQNIGVLGELQAVSRDIQVLTTDLSAGWVSKLNNAKTRIEAQLGVHRSTFTSSSIDENADRIPHERLVFGNFGDWAAGTNSTNPTQPRESFATVSGCQDSMDATRDPYRLLENCPDTGIGYSVGGIGFLSDQEEQRSSGKLSVLQRVKAFGDHQIKGGIDAEGGFLNKKRLISGDVYFTNEQGGRNRIEVFRYVALSPNGETTEEFSNQCGRGDDQSDPVACNYTPPGDVRGQTLNLASYLQDSWQPIPSLTINAGVRYEEQRLRNAEHLRGTTAVGTGELLGKNAMVLRNMWAPRLGATYDWTGEGRSKLYGSWGRYYESIPMDINDRSFGGESWMRSTYDSGNLDQCGAPDPSLGGASATPSGSGCVASGEAPAFGERLTGAGTLVASGIEAQYLDETILGVEFEIAKNTRVGLSVQNRRIGRVLEDLSTDNADTYVLANPGSWPKEEEEKLLEKIDKETDLSEIARLNNALRQFRGIRDFDAPRRDYNAVTATAAKQFSRAIGVKASYTYSATEGNYQGLFSSDNGQVDPNITSLFDLPELMANRDGPLPQDRPHLFKFDGYYSLDLEDAGTISTGLSFRAISGAPMNVTGAHYLYQQDETMLLPRGSIGRVDFDLNASAKIGYLRDLGHGMRFEGFIDVFNLNAFGFFGGQGTAAVDGSYTRSNVNPVVGGSYEDLVFLKEFDGGNGAETGRPTQRNRNFGNARELYAAPSARLTARLSF